MRAFYEGACPNCSGTISAERLVKGYACERCLPSLPSGLEDPRNYAMPLSHEYEAILVVKKKLSEFRNRVRSLTSHDPTPIQEWAACMIFRNQSIAISMPDGMGKTTLAASVCAIEIGTGKKCLYITHSASEADRVEGIIKTLVAHSIAADLRAREPEMPVKLVVACSEEVISAGPDSSRLEAGLVIFDNIAQDETRRIGALLQLDTTTSLFLSEVPGKWNRMSKMFPNVDHVLSRKIQGLSAYNVYEIESPKLSSAQLANLCSTISGQRIAIVDGTPASSLSLPSNSAAYESGLALECDAKSGVRQQSRLGALRGIDILIFNDLPETRIELKEDSLTQENLASLESILRWLNGIEGETLSSFLKKPNKRKTLKWLTEELKSASGGKRKWASGVCHFELVTDGIGIRSIDVASYAKWLSLSVQVRESMVKWPTVLLISERDKLRALEAILREIHDPHITSGALESLAEHARQGVIGSSLNPHVEVDLLIVESPTKARTVAQIFGRIGASKKGELPTYWTQIGRILLRCVATGGHIYDLVLEGGFHGVRTDGNRFAPAYGFIEKCPKCGKQVVSVMVCGRCGSQELRSKEGLMRGIRSLSASAKSVFVATDPDAEGEKIAIDISAYVSPFANDVKRVTFHELTKRAIVESLQSPREISMPLVEAQMVRRIEDRWIGFELSKRLWENFSSRHLSAGRAQTPVLGWVVDRVRESKEKKIYLIAQLDSGIAAWVDVTGRDDIKELKKMMRSAVAEIEVIREETREIKPFPPYTTDSLLRDSFSFLHINPNYAMRLAQDLFEMGLITYHRTDSTRTSSYGIEVAKTYLDQKFPGQFRPRTWQKEGAHEAIRATRSLDLGSLLNKFRSGELKLSKQFTGYHQRLYEMIFRRFISSQMRAATVVYQHFRITLNDFVIEKERRVEVKEPGFTMMVPLKIEQRINPGHEPVKSVSKRTMPKVWLFTVGDIVTAMKQKEIGRPSTYAKIIDTILTRRYAFEVNGRIISTKLGNDVSDYLRSRYGKYISEEATRKLERTMKRIEDGQEECQEVLSELYREVISLPPAK